MLDSPESSPQSNPEWWDARYQAGDIPWDTGIVPPEIVMLLKVRQSRPGWALDLGCGTGLNTCYLAAHGLASIGVDLAPSALVLALRRARHKNVPAYFCCADVSDLSFLRVQAALAVDVGCFHALSHARRASYIDSLAGHLLRGALYLLYVHCISDSHAEDGPVGADERAIAEFAPRFDLVWTAHGEDRSKPAAWHLMRRR